MELINNFFNNKRILITGGGGYLGSKVAERLLDYNCSIYLLDINFNKISKLLFSKNRNIFKLPSDLNNFEKLKSDLQNIKPNLVFHFAALLKRERDFSLYDNLYQINVKGTLNLLESIKDIDYDGFYYSSSSEVYGSQNKSPFNEKQISLPTSPYSLTKLMAENLIQTFSNIYNKPYTIFRIFNFYGPDMPKNFFISQLESSLKKNEEFKMTAGDQIRDFLHIDEVCHYILSLTCKPQIRGGIINICSGKGIKLKSLAVEIALKMQKTDLLKIGALEYRKNEIWEMIGDNTKLKNLLGGIN